MASSVLIQRRVLVQAQRVGGSARPVALRRPQPFAARRIFAKAAQQDAEAPSAVTQQELANLIEEEDIEDIDAIEDVYASMAQVADDDEGEVRDLSEEDWAAAMEAAELLSREGLDAAALAAIAADEEEDEGDREYAAAMADELLDARLEAGDVTVEELSALTADLDDAELDEVVPEDMTAAQSSDRYEEVPATAEDKELMQQYKLSKPELRNLLPEDWDQINVDFFSNKKDENIPLPEYRLNVLWTDKNLAVAIDQVYSRGQVSPLTEYFFWPRQDAWEDLRQVLEARPWISERDRIILLNRLTQLINFWQDEEVKHTIDEARVEFPDCAFAVA